MNSDIAIEVKDVVIQYGNRKKTSIKKILKKRKKSEGYLAVNGVSFTLKKGEILGILGKNGCGKSTLLRALAGVYSPSSGEINLGSKSVSLLSLGLGFERGLSGRENIMLSGLLMGFTEEEILKKMDEIIEFSELGKFIEKSVSTYSSGMYSKLAFSISIIMKADILLLDEILSVGDLKFRRKSFNRMKELIQDRNRTVVIVSHSTSTIEQLCDKVMWMEDGKVRMYGDAKEVAAAYVEYMES